MIEFYAGMLLGSALTALIAGVTVWLYTRL